MKRPESKRLLWSLATLIVLGAAVSLGLLTVGTVAFGDGNAANTPERQPASERAFVQASKTVARVHLGSSSIRWTASTFQRADGLCIEINGNGATSTGSVGSCGISRGVSYGAGGLDLDGTFYRVVYGRSPAAAAALRVQLANGAELPNEAGFAGRGIWFAAFPTTAGDASGDVTSVDLLTPGGTLVAHGKPPAISAYERASLALHPAGR